MAKHKAGAVFISYRRDDAGSEARAVRDAIDHAFGKGACFFDTNATLGTEWPALLRKQLAAASTVLVVIGPRWLTASDKWGRRRIDDQADWVRQEVAFALRQKEKRVIPVIVDAGELPPAEALPAVLMKLPTRQAVPLRRDFWDNDIQLLVVQLHEMYPTSKSTRVRKQIGPYPVMNTRAPAALSDLEVDAIVRTTLTKWKYLKSQLPENPRIERKELFREYRFGSFQETIRFMREVSTGCDIADHHPRWENIYRTLRVYLTTWGIGHHVTDRDVQLARYLTRPSFVGAEVVSEFVGLNDAAKC
jgi:pterin-4a-carbinolamine dehydratase